jgi:hypothetical protein
MPDEFYCVSYFLNSTGVWTGNCSKMFFTLYIQCEICLEAICVF